MIQNKKIPFLVRILLPLVLVFILLVTTAYLLKNSSNFLKNSEIPSSQKITIDSEFEQVTFQISNKQKLDEFLKIIGFWDGVNVEIQNLNTTTHKVVTPSELNIHITGNEYQLDRTVWGNGIYVASSKMTEGTSGSIDFWIGINSDLAEGTIPGLDYWLTSKFVSGMLSRSSKKFDNLEFDNIKEAFLSELLFMKKNK